MPGLLAPFRHRRALLVAGCALIALAQAAHAEDRLDDIIVTAEKHDTMLQLAPLAITALNAGTLRASNVNELNDINGLVPGLTIAKSEGAERVIAIRGIGFESAQNPDTQPGVSFNIDGVYIAHVMALAQDLIDVERIEVLRGPQGTVFGETSTGGAINVISHKPELGKLSGNASIGYGNYNLFQSDAALNIPLSETLALRVAGQYRRHDGYGYATQVPGTNGNYPLSDANDGAMRAALLWQPAPDFSATLSVQGFSAKHNAFLQKDILDTNPNPWAVSQDFPGKYHLETRMATLTLEKKLGDKISLKSVSAYQYLDKNQSSDNDRLASPYYADNILTWQDKSKTFTQEVSLANAHPQAVEWVLGGFYLHQSALQNIVEVATPPAGFFPYNGLNIKFENFAPFQHSSLAGYGQLSAHVTPKLTIIEGARWQFDRITAQPSDYFAAPLN
ncbi:MAG: TonB-dependent receptor plug domain-containing protein, partial [Alphaproteobacteria bacterium]|nr:TonB-dependent receptor plug domain-containing protein [Alphaproteobacteria bacterium]